MKPNEDVRVELFVVQDFFFFLICAHVASFSVNKSIVCMFGSQDPACSSGL